MVLRFLGTAALAVLCASCATVSMQPATVTTSIVRPKSDLQRTAEAFNEQADEAGWVERHDAMSFLSRSLFGSEQGNERQDYVTRINAETASVSSVRLRLEGDVTTALAELVMINALASDLLDSGNEIVRGDVTSFEDALITARDSRRAFVRAADMLNDRDAHATGVTLTSLSAMETEIERMRSLADQLVHSWRNDDVATS